MSERHYFEGDLNQMRVAREVARMLGVVTQIDGGLSYVETKEEYDTVVKYIIDNRIEGWWNYVSREQYIQLTKNTTERGWNT